MVKQRREFNSKADYDGHNTAKTALEHYLMRLEEEKAIASFVSKIKSGLQDTSGEKIIAPEYVNALGKRYRKTRSTSPAELVAFLRVFTNLPAHNPFEWDDFPENVQNERAEKASAAINLAKAIIRELQETHSGYTPALRCIWHLSVRRPEGINIRENIGRNSLERAAKEGDFLAQYEWGGILLRDTRTADSPEARDSIVTGIEYIWRAAQNLHSDALLFLAPSAQKALFANWPFSLIWGMNEVQRKDSMHILACLLNGDSADMLIHSRNNASVYSKTCIHHPHVTKILKELGSNDRTTNEWKEAIGNLYTLAGLDQSMPDIICVHENSNPQQSIPTQHRRGLFWEP